MTGRIWGAENAWIQAGFHNGSLLDANGVAVHIPLGAFKHVVGCVSAHS